ncbi:hypothetical protein ACJJTC_014546 [Scirpophaga incertulas]
MVSEVIRPTAPPATFAVDLHSPNMPLAWKNFSISMKIYMTANNLDGEPGARKVAILLNVQLAPQAAVNTANPSSGVLVLDLKPAPERPLRRSAIASTTGSERWNNIERSQAASAPAAPQLSRAAAGPVCARAAPATGSRLLDFGVAIPYMRHHHID